MKQIAKIIIALYYKARYWNKCKIQILSSTIINHCVFEGENIIGKNSYLNNTTVGLGSFMGYGAEFKKCRIGKFCSIGNNVKVISANHPLNMVSTHPAFYSGTYPFSFFIFSEFREHLFTESGFECEIGNDVWIGDNVLIKGGIKIGDGAVIGMGSIVLHDVEPYSIVAGVPARLIRKRFSDDIINSIQNSGWWDKPKSWLSNNAKYFSNPDMFISNINCEQYD